MVRVEDVTAVAEALRTTFPTIKPSVDPAWTMPTAHCVIDCVLSLNRNYDRFVVPRVAAFAQKHPHVLTIRALRDAMDAADSPAVFCETALSYRHTERAVILSAVVDLLLSEITKRPDMDERSALREWACSAKPAAVNQLAIRGFKIAGWQYLRMLFGADTAKPDVHILRFVSKATGKDFSPLQALTLLEEAARVTGVRVCDADTSIWEWSARKPSPGEPST